eukprot:jgi/Tetstr1/460825/TSEL_005986.t1
MGSSRNRDANTCRARCVLAARAIATFFLWKFFVKMHVPSQSGVTELPELLVGDDDVATMAKVWAPFFDCAHISENTSFNAADRVREWHNDNEMRRGIQHMKNQRFTKSTNTCQPCRAGSLSPTLLVDNRYYQVVGAPRQAGGSSKPASQPPPPGSGGDDSQNGAATDLCDRVADLGDGLVEARLTGSMGEETAWTFIGGGKKHLPLDMGDVHASPPKGGVNPAFATGCPRCKDLAGGTPCFRIFLSMHPNTGAMMPGPEWQILSYHVPGMSAFLPEVDHEDEARRRKYETARTMAAAKEMRH